MPKKELKKYLSFAVLAVAVCYVVQNFGIFENMLSLALGAVSPLVMGAVIAYIFNIVMDFFEKHYFPKKNTPFINRSRRPVCIVLSFLSAIAIIVLILTIVIPEIISAFRLLTDKIPPVFNELKDLFLHKLSEYPEMQKEAKDLLNEFDMTSLDWASITRKTADIIQSGIMGIISSALGIAGAVAGTVTNIVLAVIFAVYLLARKDKLLKDINRVQSVYCSKEINKKINRVCKTANETFRNFFVGQFIEAILLGCLCFAGMLILRLPYAGMTGALIGVTALIPIVGAFIGAGISAFIIFTESPMQAFIFLVFLIILQQFEGNVIYPKVVGNTVGLPGIWVLASITVGGGLWGIAGMLVGVPLAATIYKLCFENLEKKERTKRNTGKPKNN